MKPLVSVVVPTYRRNHLLRRCLAALAAQDYPGTAWEIIVVDDAASEETRQLVESRAWAPVMDGVPGDSGAHAAPARGEQRHAVKPGGREGACLPFQPTENLPARRPDPREADVENRTQSNLASRPLAVHELDGSILSLPWLEGPESGNLALDDAADVLLETHYSLRTTRHAMQSAATALERVAAASSATAAAANMAKLNVRYLPVCGGPLGPAAARNRGWQAAQGEIIAFTDDDCIPVPGWLAAGVGAFAAGTLAVSGRILMPLADVPTDYELDATGLIRSEFVTANCFYRRSALQAAGGFDERFRIAWREDSDLFFTLLAAAERSGGDVPTGAGQLGELAFRQAPDALVVHPIRRAPWGISLRQQRKNLYNALLYKKHPELYRARLGGRTPWRYYAIVAALLAMPLALLLRQEPTAAAALVVWLALTMRLTSLRLQCTSHAPAHVAEMFFTSALIPPVALFWRLAGAMKYRVWFL